MKTTTIKAYVPLDSIKYRIKKIIYHIYIIIITYTSPISSPNLFSKLRIDILSDACPNTIMLLQTVSQIA
jgi:hypothetical protein